MKISILLPDLRGGGVERIRLVLAREFVLAGHTVEFLLMQSRGELLVEAEQAFSVVDLKCTRVRKLSFPLARYLRRRRPDVLLAGMWPLTGIASQTARFSSPKTRVIVSEHVDFRFTPSLKKFEKKVLKKIGHIIYSPAHRIVAVSHGVADSLRESVGIPGKKITVIHNPVRPVMIGTISRDDKTLLETWLKSSIRLIAVGALKEQKRFDVLLKALANMSSYNDAELLILGEGQLRAKLEQQAEELGLSERVHMPGFRENVHDYFTHASCFVLSSSWEGFGNVVVEALSVGCAVVSTDCPSGPREILNDGRFGKLVPVGDHKALSEAIEESVLKPYSVEVLVSRANDFLPSSKAAEYLTIMAE